MLTDEVHAEIRPIWYGVYCLGQKLEHRRTFCRSVIPIFRDLFGLLFDPNMNFYSDAFHQGAHEKILTPLSNSCTPKSEFIPRAIFQQVALCRVLFVKVPFFIISFQIFTTNDQ